MKTLFFAISAFIAFGCTGPSVSGAPEQTSRDTAHARAIDAIRPAILQITGYSFETHREFPLGTAFLVNRDGYAITALHVLTSGDKQLGGGTSMTTANVRFPSTEEQRGQFFGGTFTRVDVDKLNDLALLRLSMNPFNPDDPNMKAFLRGRQLPVSAVTFDQRRPVEGARISVSGFPFGAPVLITNSGWIASSWAFTLHPTTGPTGYFSDTYIADLSANPGNSGGPVYLVDDASVIGVCHGIEIETATGARTGNMHVIPIRYVIALLKKNGVTWMER